MKEHLKTSIKQARRERNMSQAELAKAVGVSHVSVGKWESGAISSDYAGTTCATRPPRGPCNVGPGLSV